MIPVSFNYTKAHSVADAIAAVAAGGKVLAGGHSLIPAMKLRLNQPESLVDISQIAALKGIREENGEIIIGAATTHHDIANNAIIQAKLPFFATGAGNIGDVQVRNRGTIGGSIAHADPAGDWSALILAAGASLAIDGPNGSRVADADGFFDGLFSTGLADGEIITAIHVPTPAEGTKMTYQKFAQPASRFALVGCAIMRSPSNSVRIAFTGVADYPFRDKGAEGGVTGAVIDKRDVDAACMAAVQGVDVMSDHYASAHYRTHLAKVYLKRALEAVK
jgi:carbon-monoxide dehydrogenase medium subunit